MLDYSVQPFVGVGPVRFGMSPDQVRQAMPEPPESFRKTPTSQHNTDSFYESAFQVFYEGAEPTVQFIELSRDGVVRAFYGVLDGDAGQ
jgi:hypothetical protein